MKSEEVDYNDKSWSNQKLITSFHNVMAKREYKNHKNGHGILIYNCSQCNIEMDDICTRGMKPKLCSNCKEYNRKNRHRKTKEI